MRVLAPVSPQGFTDDSMLTLYTVLYNNVNWITSLELYTTGLCTGGSVLTLKNTPWPISSDDKFRCTVMSLDEYEIVSTLILSEGIAAG